MPTNDTPPIGLADANTDIGADPRIDDPLAPLAESGAPPSTHATEPAHAPPPPSYYATLYPGQSTRLPSALAEPIGALEEELAMPVWLLVQPSTTSGPSHLDDLGHHAYLAHLSAIATVPQQEVAILVDSFGGYADSSYRLARLFQRRCGSYMAIVPRVAKSAATLFALGATEIVLGDYGELGPLDAQLFDADREKQSSALDEVHAIDLLHTRALRNVDEAMWTMIGRTKKKVDTLLPMVLSFEAQFVRPLLENIDAVHYTRLSRILKVGREYAKRLLLPQYSRNAEDIAHKLVEEYPEHGFVIDRDEADRIGLRTTRPRPELSEILDELCVALASNESAWLGCVRTQAQEEGT